MTRAEAIAIVMDALYRVRYSAAQIAPVAAALGVTVDELLASGMRLQTLDTQEPSK